MTTKKQIAANRRNARKSTGPRTEAGKAKSALNATKHGLTSRRVVLDDEDEGKYRDFRYSIFDDLEPNGNLETALACRIAEKLWRLRRVPEIEADLLERLRDNAGARGEFMGGDGEGDRNRGGTPWLGAAWAADGGPYGGALARLARYESALERGVTRLTAELRRAKAQRVAREKRWAEEDAREAAQKTAQQAEDARQNPGNSHAPPGAPPKAPPSAPYAYSPDAAERRGEGSLYGGLPVDARNLNRPIYPDVGETDGDTGVQGGRRILRNEPISAPTDAASGADWNRR